jgi:uncharacterized membrane protein YedE/YeeE
MLMPLLGGAMIGLAALILLAANGRVMGASGIWSGLIRWSDGPHWRLAFVAGAIAGPILLAALGRPGQVQIDTPMPVFLIAGLLVGLGTAIGSGCTSGHGICGISRLSPRSIVATIVFMAVGLATVFVVRHIF